MKTLACEMLQIYPWEISVKLVEGGEGGKSWEETKVGFQPFCTAIGWGHTLRVWNICAGLSYIYNMCSDYEAHFKIKKTHFLSSVLKSKSKIST